MVPLPEIAFSHYPMNLQMLYLGALHLGSDIWPKYIHLAFGAMTALLLAAYLRPRLGTGYGLVGALLFLTLPVVVRLSTVAYVDLGLVFFTTAAVMAMIRWSERGCRMGDLALSAVCCGLAAGTKYNGLITLFLMTLMAAFIGGRRSYRQGRGSLLGLGPALLFLTVALAVFAPWGIRNYLWTGNPVFPLFNGVFNAAPAATAGAGAAPSLRLDHFTYRRVAFGEPWWMIVLVPVRIFLHGADNDPRLFDGVLNPYLLVLPLLALYTWRDMPSRDRRANGLWAAFAGLFIFIVFFQIDMRVRWVLPAVPALVVLCVYGLAGAGRRITAVTVRAPAKGRLLTGGFVVFTAGLAAFNVAYAVDLYARIAPMDYIANRVSRDAYIAARRPEYRLFAVVNGQLPKDAGLLGFFMGGRYYYCDRPVKDGRAPLLKAVRSADDDQDIASLLNARGGRYLIMHVPLTRRWLADNLSPGEMGRFNRFAAQRLVLLDAASEYALFEVRP